MQQAVDRHDGDRAAHLAGGVDDGCPEREPGERARSVVHDDHVDLARRDVVGQHLDRRPLGPVTGGAAVDHEHLAVAEVRRHGGLDGVPVLGSHDEHEAAYVGER